jgi:hypothetical protein
MVDLEIDTDGLDAESLERALASALAAEPPTAVVRVRLIGDQATAAARSISASDLRALAPQEMIVEWSRRGLRAPQASGPSER